MSIVSHEQMKQFQREGYFILESVIPNHIVEALRDECMRIIAIYDKEMEEKGLTKLRINHYKKRYFVANRSPGSPIMTEFLFSELMADICRATIGDEAYLYNEQYVVKAADTDTRFAWHQDSGYVGHYHSPFLSCWCALDDMSLENGTLYVLPYSRDGRRDSDEITEHPEEASSNDKVGYHGDDPGDPAIVPVGSIVVFSSRTFHRSGANLTNEYRRSYLAQYSTEPIMTKDGSAVLVRAEPLLRNGARIDPGMAAAASWAPMMSGGGPGKGSGAE